MRMVQVKMASGTSSCRGRRTADDRGDEVDRTQDGAGVTQRETEDPQVAAGFVLLLASDSGE